MLSEKKLKIIYAVLIIISFVMLSLVLTRKTKMEFSHSTYVYVIQEKSSLLKKDKYYYIVEDSKNKSLRYELYDKLGYTKKYYDFLKLTGRDPIVMYLEVAVFNNSKYVINYREYLDNRNKNDLYYRFDFSHYYWEERTYVR